MQLLKTKKLIQKTVSFGQKGATYYTLYDSKNRDERKKTYIATHSLN